MKKKAVKKSAPKAKAAKKAPAKSHAAKSAAAVENKTGVRPLGDRVLVRPLSAEETGRTLASGIIIPDTASKEKPEQGTVIAVGPGKFDDGVLVPMNVEVGDRVVFSKYGYDEVKVDGVEYFMVSEANILAVITK